MQHASVLRIPNDGEGPCPVFGSPPLDSTEKIPKLGPRHLRIPSSVSCGHLVLVDTKSLEATNEEASSVLLYGKHRLGLQG